MSEDVLEEMLVLERSELTFLLIILQVGPFLEPGTERVFFYALSLPLASNFGSVPYSFLTACSYKDLPSVSYFLL